MLLKLETDIKKEDVDSVENSGNHLGTIKISVEPQDLPICLVKSVQGAGNCSFDFQHNNKSSIGLTQEVIQNECDNLQNNTNKKCCDTGNSVRPTNFLEVNINLNKIATRLTNPVTCNKPTCFKESAKKQSNLTLCTIETLDEPLKSEIDFNETELSFQTEQVVKFENFNRIPQLQIILHRLSIANESHKKEIQNLANPIIQLKRIDLRIIQKINKNGFIKISSDFLKPLLPQLPKKLYPKGHYFSRLRDVTYVKEKFDKRFFHNALRRGANIDDKGKFLKYQCPTCPYKTWSFYALSKHHKGLHGSSINWTFTCPDCNFTAKHECTLKRHQQRHKKEPDLPCPHCPYITRFDVALRVHLRRWHLPEEEAKTLKCTYCNFVSVCKTTYDAHMMVHLKGGEKYLSRFLHNSMNCNGAEILKCEYCKFQTADKNGLRRHMRETHKINNAFRKNLYRCKDCGFETKHRFSFLDHKLLHKNVEDENLLKCYDCGFKTKWKKYLTLHMRTDHARAEPQKEKVFYYCAECDKKFPKKYPLKSHIFKEHRDAEVLMCHDCNYTTKTMAVLKRHTLTKHINPVKPIFKCQKCSLISKDRAKHKAHLRTHKYECYMCGFKTDNKTTLRYHIIGHMSKEKQNKLVTIHMCDCCNYETRNKHHYERHKRRWSHYLDIPMESKVKVEDDHPNKLLETRVEVYHCENRPSGTDESLKNRVKKEIVEGFADKASDVDLYGEYQV